MPRWGELGLSASLKDAEKMIASSEGGACCQAFQPTQECKAARPAFNKCRTVCRRQEQTQAFRSQVKKLRCQLTSEPGG